MKKVLQIVLLAVIVVGATIGIILGFIYFSQSSEPKFSKLILSNDFENAGRIFGTDVDGDGDIDVICASGGRNEIAWWENDELTFTKHIITDNFGGVFFINIGDIDQDGDPDVLGPAWTGDEVAWWENNDTTFIKHSLKTNYESAYSINSYDVDLDGDIDILSTGTQDVTWWENDGNLNFTEHTISSGYPEIFNQGHANIFARDLDNDGDVDICTGSTATPPNVGEICCWENNGNNTFTKVQITTNYGRVHDLKPIDMDSDGDMDICTNSAVDNTIDWFENTGNLTFSRHTIGSINGPDTIFPVDLDKDGDFDVIAVSYLDDKLSWFENFNNQTFTEYVITINFNGAATCSAIDIDGDSDVDVLGAAYDGNEVAIWLQN